MSKKYKFGLFVMLPALVLLSCAIFLQDSNFALLNPKGIIAVQQRDLLVASTILMLVIVLPVLILTFVIAWRYREGNIKAKYSPDLSGNRAAETIWWTIPLIIIVILSGMIWKSSHELDPFKPLVASEKPLTIQVVALDWKWLFIYPEQNIATINFVQFPEDTPVEFKLTADAPMNSFWIPQLGGQLYAMAGMETRLNLLATETGEFTGQSANLSGEGFSGMKFIAKSSSATEFDQWVEAVKLSPHDLTNHEYRKLVEPSKNNPPVYYASKEKNLYSSIISKYLSPDGTINNTHNQHGGNH